MVSPKKTVKKSTTLGINKLDSKITILDVAKAFSSQIECISEIKIITTRFDTRNALVSFKDVESCEKAKCEAISLKGTEYPMFFAQNHHRAAIVSASENKVYVKYPQEEDYTQIEKMIDQLSLNLKISKPENTKNYCFVTAEDIDQQISVIKELNNKSVEGGILSAKVAIDKSAPRRRTKGARD